jgi:hypothetical protein
MTIFKSGHRIIKMKSHLTKLAVAALLIAAPALTARAEDAPAPAAKHETPASVPRPSIVPKAAAPAPTASAAQTAPSAATTDATPAKPRVRRSAHRYHRRHGVYRAGYFGPFYVVWPRIHWPRIHWQRTAWRGWW